MKKIHMTALALLMALGFAQPVAAQSGNPVELGRFGAWKAFSFADVDSKGKVCFMSAVPEKQEGKFSKRGDVAFFITHWSNEGTRDVVSVSIGYPFKKGSALSLSVDGKTYKMVTDGEMAWAANNAADAEIAAAVRRGSKMTIKGVSQRGTETTDTYSLTGSGDAYKAIGTACGL